MSSPGYDSCAQILARLVSNSYVTRRLAIAVALAAFIACGSVFWHLHLLTKRVRFIAATAYELAQAKQTPSMADIRQRFSSGLRDECVGSECTYTVTVSNRVLAVLHIAPYTELQSYFWTRDGVLLENMLNYTTTVNRDHRVVSMCRLTSARAVDTFPCIHGTRRRRWTRTGLCRLAMKARLKACVPYFPSIQTASQSTTAAGALPICCPPFGSKRQK